MRRGEALALTWDDLDRYTPRINKTISHSLEGHIISNTPKTTSSNRTIIISENLYNLLNTLEKSSEYIFSNSKGTFITPSQPIRKLKTMTGIRYISPHGFRHTHCALLFSAGISISEVQHRLGHKDLKTTLNIYNHVYKEDAEKAHEKYLAFMG